MSDCGCKLIYCFMGKHVLRRGQRVPGEMMDVLDVNDTPLGAGTTLALCNIGSSFFFSFFF